jgi:NAD(P)-dependent dehydrogenase (short-subunit alcohol dehydrogenase family)
MTVSSATFPARRTAIVTGAGAPRGIGRHVARRLAADGWSLALIDINASAIAEFVVELNAEHNIHNQKIIDLCVDIADEAAIQEAFVRIDNELPPVFAVVNLAGIACSEEFMRLTPHRWDDVMGINAKGTFLMSQAAAQRMIRHKAGGRIVNAASLTAFDGGGTFSKTAYAAAKAAVLGLTRGAARELGKYQITVNAIAPGPIDTDIMGGQLTDERKASMAADIPVGRVGQPREVAGLINYLVGEDAGFVNGATYVIDGGKHMF